MKRIPRMVWFLWGIINGKNAHSFVLREWRRQPRNCVAVQQAAYQLGTVNRECRRFAATRYTITCPPTDPSTLEALIGKHVSTLDRFLESKPIAIHTHDAFSQVLAETPLSSENSKIILDSGCGTGKSSLLLGEMNPDCSVIGIDRSEFRLTKNERFTRISGDDERRNLLQQAASNVWLVRAELIDFWRCVSLDKSIKIHEHYVLYPNPYPKKSRLKSRFYGHPGFPLMLMLGGERIILRSNWETYLKEFALSVQYADSALQGSTAESNYARPYVNSCSTGPQPLSLTSSFSSVPLTNFERKYVDVGESLFELVLDREGRSEASSERSE